MNPIYLSIAVLGAPLGLLSAQNPPVHYERNAPINQFTTFARSFFKAHRKSVLQRWMEKYHNPNSDLDGEMHTELHRGYRFEFIQGDRYKTDELACVVITDPTIKLPLGLSLGDSEEKVEKKLGPPSISKPDYFEYELSYEMCFVTTRFRRGRLIEIEISFDHE